MDLPWALTRRIHPLFVPAPSSGRAPSTHPSPAPPAPRRPRPQPDTIVDRSPSGPDLSMTMGCGQRRPGERMDSWSEYPPQIHPDSDEQGLTDVFALVHAARDGKQSRSGVLDVLAQPVGATDLGLDRDV